MDQGGKLSAPVAQKINKELTVHDDTRIDPYYWLNQRTDQKVIDYLNAENAYTDQEMAHTKALQEELFQEMKGRIKEKDQSVPYRDNGYYYLTRFEEGQEYPIYSRKEGTLDAGEEVMLNVNELAKGHEFYNVGGRSVSPDNQLLAFGEDTVSRRIYNIRFRNLQTGEFLDDVIPNTSGNAVWASDNQTVFYVLKDEQTLRSYKVYRHRIGTDVAEDVLVYHEEDETFLSYIFKTKSKKYIVIGSYQTISQEYRVLQADTPEGDFRVIQPRKRGLEYDIAHYRDQFYIRTNHEALNFRLMVTDELATALDNWQEVVPHRSNVLLEDMEIFRDFIVLTERINGISELRIIPRQGEEHYISFREDAHMAYVGTNPEFDTTVLRIGYQSMKTPPTVYDYHMVDRSFTQLKQTEVLGGFNIDDYASERLFATTRDGVKVPISVIYPHNFRKDGTGPMLLYAYGSYGHSMDPYFSSARLSLLDRGFAYAIAHIRGGEEMGRQWYEDGKLLKKKNTFNDFIDCAEFLIAEQFTSSERLFAMGGSAGGLLMGAILNLRPDLWKGVVAAVPFVDVVTTMLDDTIPLTTFEYDEWGNPKDKAFYDYIKSYSPYDNVAEKEYPALLVTTGLHDSQVQYWEPAKWVAKLRELKTGDHLLLLHTNMDAGHGGASGRFKRLKETALHYAFLLDLARQR